MEALGVLAHRQLTTTSLQQTTSLSIKLAAIGLWLRAYELP
jgi:hypothetical protein